jgi:RNA polymerase sigma-70 factor (ECF subfamily)
MDEHGPLVYSLALRITGSEADAEDVVREVFVGVPEALHDFDGHDFRTWLTMIATRHAYQYAHSDRGPREVESNPTSGYPEGRSTDADGLARHDLEAAIAGLEDGQRVVFVLKEVEGLAHEEVAATLGISAGLSRVRLHRARKALIERFQALNLGMKHPTQFMMSRFIDRDLPPGTHEPIEEHLEICTSCRQYVGWLRDLQHVARALRPPRPTPPRFADDVIRRRHERNAGTP